jgi:hypothetical protein
MSIFQKQDGQPSEFEKSVERTLNKGVSFFKEEKQTFNVICVGADPAEKDRTLKQFAFSIEGDTKSRLKELAKPYIQLEVLKILKDLANAAKKFGYEFETKNKNTTEYVDKYLNDFHSIKDMKIKDLAKILEFSEDEAIIKATQRLDEIETHHLAK